MSLGLAKCIVHKGCPPQPSVTPCGVFAVFLEIYQVEKLNMCSSVCRHEVTPWWMQSLPHMFSAGCCHFGRTVNSTTDTEIAQTAFYHKVAASSYV